MKLENLDERDDNVGNSETETGSGGQLLETGPILCHLVIKSVCQGE